MCASNESAIFSPRSSRFRPAGKATIESIHSQFPPVESELQIDAAMMTSLPGKMRAAQSTFDRTGGLHAAALFDGSRFNYAILASDTDPAAIARVVIMPRAGGSASVVASAPGQTTRPAMPAQARSEDSDEDAQPEEAPAEEVQPQAEQPQPEQQQQPGQTKTPEQLLQELQQMQQQQQQQQNPNGQQPPQQQQIPDREIPDDQAPQ